MFTDLNVFQLANAMATHAGNRQAVIARNVANADTPGYQARDLTPFADFVSTGESTSMRASRPGHLNGTGGNGQRWSEFAESATTDPNGNSVSVEQEMLKAADVRREHDRALAIYKAALGILRTSLGRV